MASIHQGTEANNCTCTIRTKNLSCDEKDGIVKALLQQLKETKLSHGAINSAQLKHLK
mgnify:CR=1 FL=1